MLKDPSGSKSTALLISMRKLPESEDHDDGVREVEEGGHKLVDLQLRHEVEEAVGRHVHRRAARHDK